MINNYNVYGLNIKSEIEIEEFIKLDTMDENNIVNIIKGEMSEDIKSEIENGSKIKLLKDKIWFHIDNIATYCISNGNDIKVEVCENADMKLMKVYIMCSCLGFIMLQRNMVAIHGGVIEMDNKAVIFTGDRGAGKSTLTTALRERGYNFISDDVASTKIEKVPYVMPGFPYQKLCESAMDNFEYDKEKYTSFMSDNEIKYMVPAKDEFVYEPKPLSAIVKLTVGDVEEVTIQELLGGEKLNNIIENIYRGEYIKYLGGMNPMYFKQCIDVAKNIRFFKVVRPANKFTVNEQVELIERQILVSNETAV
ncbi:hypothetical protein [Clostridium sp. D53t1_180928_C8]|uniref:hypothetical protein n=1 Tax=Clostridium sp. D53t1_180928_C8 TaxID=2787101 RepID=UPI001FABC022|nr:hypothetical protein [Clostridium sp. D53t1_180928_C8]